MGAWLASLSVVGVLCVPAAAASPFGQGEYTTDAAIVHYVEDGPASPPALDANTDGVPDYVEAIAVALREASEQFRQRGFAGVGQVAVYIGQREPGDYGETVVADDGVAIVLLGNRLPAGLVQVTAAHELFHVVQLEYGPLPDWVAEGTATEAGRSVFPAVHDAARVEFERHWLRQPGRSLDSVDAACVRCYGSSIWWRFVAERWPAVIPRLFERLSAHTAENRERTPLRSDLRAAFADTGATLAAAYVSFANSLAVAKTKPRFDRPWNVTRAPRSLVVTLAPLAARYIPLRIAPARVPLALELRPLRAGSNAAGVSVAQPRTEGPRIRRLTTRRVKLAIDRRFGIPVLVVTNGTSRPAGVRIRIQLLP